MLGADPAARRVGVAGGNGERGAGPRGSAGESSVSRGSAGSRHTSDGPLPGRRVVAALLPAHSDPALAAALEGAGFQVEAVVDLVALLDGPGLTIPDVAVVDDDELSDLGPLESLRAEGYAYLPAVVIGRRPERRVAALRQGADDFVVRPFDPEDLVERLRLLVRRSRALRDMSPLTGLPGNVEIDEALSTLVGHSGPGYAVVYADLDNFKAYNDEHGFVFGDDVLRATARVLRDALRRHPSPINFIGHLGGDDFVLVTDVSNVEALCEDVVRRFDTYAATMPRVPAGRGPLRRFRRAALSISLGVATTEHRPLASVWEISAVATEMKRVAKATPRSCYAFDRRSGWARMPEVGPSIEVHGRLG